jgi:hypothetical protein
MVNLIRLSFQAASWRLLTIAFEAAHGVFSRSGTQRASCVIKYKARLSEAKSGSTQTCRLHIAFRYASVAW